MNNKTVFIVEDEQFVAKTMQNGLKKLGYNVPNITASGEEAIIQIGEMQLNPDLVLMDIKLKGDIDGIETAKQIQNRFDIPVVFITAYADKNTLQRANITNYYGYIVKPFVIKEIHSAIQIALQKWKEESQLKESEHWLEKTLRSFGYAVITVDTNEIIKYMNPISELITGWNQKEALGKSLLEVFRIKKERPDVTKENIALKIISDDVSCDCGYETILITKDGIEKSIYYYLTPIFENDVVMHGAVIIFQANKDKNSEEDIQKQSIDNLAMNKQEVKDFANSFLHNLKDPQNISVQASESNVIDSIRVNKNSLNDSTYDKELNHSDSRLSGFDNIIGKSFAILNILEIISQIETSDANVLITGETGTGKDLIANTIHNHSMRKDKKFVTLICVAIPANLLESELFGFEKGAFTGAFSKKYGLLEFAHKGTIFFDEISELETNLQAKLLQVIQEQQFRRVGGKELIKVDMRIIAAMNKNPIQEIADNKLRKDLYYRLNVIPIHIPPLRKRIEDIPLLTNHFLKITLRKHQMDPKEISQNAMDLLMEYTWPGNVRQIKNIIERIVLLSKSTIIDVKDLPDYIKTKNIYFFNSNKVPLYKEAKKKHHEIFERKYFKKILEESNFNISKAAKIAGISYRTIYRALRRYGEL